MKGVEVSIILPTYNERGNIIGLVKNINRVVQRKKEIIVVDDNSPDGTSEAVYNLIKRGNIKKLRLETRKKDRGLTKSIWRGIKLSRGDIIVWMDCDFSHPPEIIPNLLKKIDRGYDIAVASRFVRGGGFKKGLKNSNDSMLAVTLSRLMNYAIQVLLDGGFRDYTSGFIAIKREVFKKIKLQGDYGEYFIDLISRAILLNYKIVEIPFINLPRKKGVSKTGSNLRSLIKRGSKYIKMALGLFLLRTIYLTGLKDDIKSQKKRFR